MSNNAKEKLKDIIKKYEGVDALDVLIPPASWFSYPREEFEREVRKLNGGRNNDKAIEKYLSTILILCDFY